MIMKKPIPFGRRPRVVSAKRGQALVPVIFIMIILTTLVVAFALTASRELKAGSNFSAGTERFYAAKGALAYALSGLAQTSNNGATYGIVPPLPDTDTNGWMPIGDAWVKVDVMDTGGLLNLNSVDNATLMRLPVFQENPDVVAAIMDWRTPGDQASTNGAKSDYYNTLTPPYDCKSAPFDSVEELLLVKGMTPTILFGTPSGNPVTPGANSGVTTGLGANTNAIATRQAAAGPGAQPGTPGATGGTGAGATGGAGGAGAGTGTTATAGDTDWTDIYGSSTVPLSEMFTTVSRERNVAADGTPRVNINTANAQDLQDKLGISAALATTLVNFRNSATQNAQPGGAPGAGTGQIAPPTGPNGASTGIRSVGGRTRQSLGVQTGGSGATPGAPGGGAGGAPSGTPNGGAGGAPSGPPNGGTGGATPGAGGGGGGASTQVFKTIADLMNIPGRQTFDRTAMQSVADHVTVDDQPYHTNLVNINTASAEVLATVPGMDHTTLQAILDFRSGGKAFQSLGDLFTITNLTRQQYINVIAHLCTKTSLYRVRIRVKTPGQQGTYAVSALVEMTDNGPRIRQWHEVTRDVGWSYWIAPQTLPTPTPPTPAGNPGASLTTGSPQ